MKLKFRDMMIIALLAMTLSWVANVGIAYATSLKVWSTGETIRSSDLNSNFAALNAYTGLITNARIAGNAAISHTKLATPALIPKAWVNVATTCTASPCTITESSGVSSVTWTSAGYHTVNLSVGLKNADYAAFAFPRLASATAKVFCQIDGQDTSFFIVKCFDNTGAATNVAFNAFVLDADDPS